MRRIGITLQNSRTRPHPKTHTLSFRDFVREARCLLHLDALAAAPAAVVDAVVHGPESLTCPVPTSLGAALREVQDRGPAQLRFSFAFHVGMDWVLPGPSVDIVAAPEVKQWAPWLTLLPTRREAQRPILVELQLARPQARGAFGQWYCVWRAADGDREPLVASSHIVALNASFLACPLAPRGYIDFHSRIASWSTFQLYFSLAPVAPSAPSVAGSRAQPLVPSGVTVRAVGNLRVFGPAPLSAPLPAPGQSEAPFARFSGWGFSANVSIVARIRQLGAATECRICTPESPSGLLCPFSPHTDAAVHEVDLTCMGAGACGYVSGSIGLQGVNYGQRRDRRAARLRGPWSSIWFSFGPTLRMRAQLFCLDALEIPRRAVEHEVVSLTRVRRDCISRHMKSDESVCLSACVRSFASSRARARTSSLFGLLEALSGRDPHFLNVAWYRSEVQVLEKLFGH